MTYEEFLKELEALESNIFNKTDEDIDFTLLNIAKCVLAQKETKEKTEKQLQLEREVTKIIDSIVERPEFYFETKEKNMEKLIENNLSNNILPKTKEDRFVTHAETNINTMLKLFDKALETNQNQEIKHHLEACKKELKNIKTRTERKELKMKMRQIVKKTTMILEKEITKNKDMEIQ